MLVLFDCYTIVIFLVLFLWYLNCTLGIEKECDFLCWLAAFLFYVVYVVFFLLPFILTWRTFEFILNCFYFFIKNEIKNKQTNKRILACVCVCVGGAFLLKPFSPVIN